MLSMKALAYVGVVMGLLAGQAAATDVQVNAPDQTPWKDNEVHAAYAADKAYSLIDVNDKFLVKSLHDNGVNILRVAVLDGLREQYGTCTSGKNPGLGDRSTTWVSISYTKRDPKGFREFTIRRTYDFFRHDRIYSFKSSGRSEIARLEPGISFEIRDDSVTYIQTTGPIGTSGNTKSVRLKYKLTDDFRSVNLTTEMDTKMWRIGTLDNVIKGAPVYSVNNSQVSPYLSASSTADIPAGVVAPPLFGPGIEVPAEPLFVRVSSNDAEQEEITDVETEDAAAAGLCVVKRCLVAPECWVELGGGNCGCAAAAGPSVGVCVL